MRFSRERIAAPERDARGSGPVAWFGIIVATCLALLVFQKVLWLVVPFLLALILYYFLYPPMQRLVYRGMSRQAASGTVVISFLGGLAAVSVVLLPQVTNHAAQWQDTAGRYVEGGIRLLDSSLRVLEAHWGLLERANLADSMMNRLEKASGSITDHLEPVALGMLAWTPSLMLTPLLTFFLLRDGQRFKRFLGSGVPNAFFERTLFLLHEIDGTAQAYFRGLINLTILDTATLALGLWLLGMPGALALGAICAVLSWIPYVGSIVGGLLVVLVAATDFPADPVMAYRAIGLFVVVRLLDDFLYMPITVGKSLSLHPLVTVLMIFAGGAVAGIPGLMLVLPVLGVVMVIGRTLGVIVSDARLLARHRHAGRLRLQQADRGL